MQLEEATSTKEKMGQENPEAQPPEIPGRYRGAQIPIKLQKNNPDALFWRIPVSVILDIPLDDIPIATGVQLKKKI